METFVTVIKYEIEFNYSNDIMKLVWGSVHIVIHSIIPHWKLFSKRFKQFSSKKFCHMSSLVVHV